MTCRFSSNYLKASFMGRVWICESLMSSFRIEEIEFPVDAFKDFLRAEGLPMPDFWQDVPGTALKPAPAACPVTAAPSLPTECREIEAPKAPVAVPSASGIEGAGVELSEAIAFGVATRDVLNVLADYLSRPAERQISGNKNFPTKAQCVLDALDAVAKRHKWGRAGDGSGRLSKAQWEGVRALFLPPTKPDAGCKGGRWGGNTDRDT